VLVTGADGFVGSHLTETLVGWGATVYALVRRPLENLRHLTHLRDQIAFLRTELGDGEQVLRELEVLQGEEGIIVFHLAAEAHVGDSWIDPDRTLRSNIVGTLNLLEAVRKLNLKLHRFDYAGSSEEYGSFDASRAADYRRHESGSILLNESSPLNPKSVYATSKVAADFLCRNYFDAYGIPVVVTRMFNNFGPRQSPRFITGTVITQALDRVKVEIGWPHARRDFTYIEDGVRGHLLAAINGDPGQVYVFGQGRNVSIGDWARKILDLGEQHGHWNHRELVSREDRYRPGKTDEADLLADSSRLHETCGWTPEVTWEEGILNSIRWYSDNCAIWKDMIDWETPR
jgi:dTDP-glucose 4,6-dehydratase